MRILITNDDGVYSPGIAALAQVATRFGEVRVVAPDVEMSSAAQSSSIGCSAGTSLAMSPAMCPVLEAVLGGGDSIHYIAPLSFTVR